MKLIAVHPLQYVFEGLHGLDGYYLVDEYKIIPCIEERARSMQKPWQTLILTFPFEGMEENETFSENHFKNTYIAGKKAKKFVSWFTLITNIPTRLAYSGFGRGGIFFKCWHHLASDYREEESLKPFSPDLDAQHGKYEKISRPDF